MRIILRLFKWFWRAWPILILLFLIGIHILLIYYFSLDVCTTNKTISLVLQLVGGLLILYSIDSNIGIIKGKNLIAVFANYVREFPLREKPAVTGSASLKISSTLEAKATIKRNPTTIEGKLEYLQEQIDEVKQDINQESKKLNKKIEQQSKEMGTQIQETKTVLRNIESKMEKVSIGGIKVQIFGILLMVYGAISGYIA